MLRIKNISINAKEKNILKNISIDIKPGEIHAVMGPNGSGKTTLAMGLMGYPAYEIKQSKNKPVFSIDGKDLIDLTPEKRARSGLFVSFQSPVEIPGVSILAFLRTASKSIFGKSESLTEFKKRLVSALKNVGLDESFMYRSVNENFSGGEKKRLEIAQMQILKPKYVILDEIDSGLDIDSLKLIAETVKIAAKKNKIGFLIITHYQRILSYLDVNRVHIIKNGQIIKSGSFKLVGEIEKTGYAKI